MFNDVQNSFIVALSGKSVLIKSSLKTPLHLKRVAIHYLVTERGGGEVYRLRLHLVSLLGYTDGIWVHIYRIAQQEHTSAGLSDWQGRSNNGKAKALQHSGITSYRTTSNGRISKLFTTSPSHCYPTFAANVWCPTGQNFCFTIISLPTPTVVAGGRVSICVCLSVCCSADISNNRFR